MENERAKYRNMSMMEYVRLYCHKKMAEFWEKNLPRVFEQTAYHDITYYYDDENQIEIEERFYIGD